VMSVGKIREFLQQHGVDYRDCVEKSDLVERAQAVKKHRDVVVDDSLVTVAPSVAPSAKKPQPEGPELKQPLAKGLARAEWEIDLTQLDPKPSDMKRVWENKLGKGSFGMVYRAEYQYMPVAVKIVDDLSEEGKIQLHKECKINYRLHHNHVGRLFGFTLEPPNACMVMELGDLGSLYEILGNKDKFSDLPWTKRLSIAIDIAKGLIPLHLSQPPIFHRDLKSLNVLLRTNWSAFIIDFGLAKVKYESTKGTKGLGSYPWMAPEMFDEETTLTAALDIYSFGMILYELLTREIPFKGLSPMQITRAISQGNRPVIPTDIRCPEGYTKLMIDCWDEEPTKRPSLPNIISRLQEFSRTVI